MPVAKVKPVNLLCDYRESPMGIDVYKPSLSWILKAINTNERGLKQTAYQVVVSSSLELLKSGKGDLWNSGKVKSDHMGQIVYAGKKLSTSQKCWWKVKVWDQTGAVSNWSTPSSWTMGILNPTDWKAKWISASGAEKFALNPNVSVRDPSRPTSTDPNYNSMLLRHNFTVKPNLKRAVLYVSGLAEYKFAINGSQIGDDILSPGWTNYRKTILYDTYDITKHLITGNNAMGMLLGNGMYNIQPDSVRYVKFLNTFGPLKAIAQLRLEYADGSVQITGTNNTWKASPGPVTYSNIFGGEDYDARLEPNDWSRSSFNPDSRWADAIETSGPGGELKGLSCAAAPIRAIDTLKPIKITKLKTNIFIYDLGQNASLMPQITVSGSKGSYVRIIPAELLNNDGTVDRRSATQDGVRPAWWQYTLAQKGHETWMPKFFYQGSRYWQVELYPATADGPLPLVEKLEGIVVHSSSTPIGTFTSSNDLFNRIYTLIRWAQRSNMMSYMTDCPQREKLGWLEEDNLNGPSLRYNFNLNSLFTKSMNDMHDSQLDNGFVPNIAPEYFIAGPHQLTNGFRNSPEWGSSFIIVPWQQYLFSGDVSLLRRYYDDMKRYVAFLGSTAKNNIIPTGLGDWYDLGPKAPWGSQLTPVSLTATATYFYDNWILAQTARLLGKTADAEFFDKHAAEIRISFNNEFFKSETGQYSTGSQTANAMPLAFNICEPQNRKMVIEAVVADIRKHGNAITSGDVGYRYLLQALAMEGYSDVIYSMNNQSDKPGYGYQLKMGATSLTEKWNAGVGSFGSQNHFMLGQLNEWLFHDLIGIGVEPRGAGFRKVVIKPMVTGDMKWVTGSFNSVSGLITVEWTHERNLFSLDVVIPPNTSATVYIPTKNMKKAFKPTETSKGVKFIKTENDTAIYEIVSGKYHFNSSY